MDHINSYPRECTSRYLLWYRYCNMHMAIKKKKKQWLLYPLGVLDIAILELLEYGVAVEYCSNMAGPYGPYHHTMAYNIQYLFQYICIANSSIHVYVHVLEYTCSMLLYYAIAIHGSRVLCCNILCCNHIAIMLQPRSVKKGETQDMAIWPYLPVLWPFQYFKIYELLRGKMWERSALVFVQIVAHY